jgi:hypothetical protein
MTENDDARRQQRIRMLQTRYKLVGEKVVVGPVNGCCTEETTGGRG